MFENLRYIFDKNIFVTKKKFEEISKKIRGIDLYSEEQSILFNYLKEADVVFCHMPLKASTLYDIPEGHRTRPYVIVRKDDNCLYGYPASTKKTKGLISRTRFDVLHYEENDGFKWVYYPLSNRRISNQKKNTLTSALISVCYSLLFVVFFAFG